MFKKIIFAMSCLFAFLLGSSASAAEAQEEKFVVGTTSGYAPYVSLNEKGEYEGFDIDIANLIATRLKKKLEIRDLGSMPSLLMALKKKKIDAAIWAISITPQREKEMTMIYYQGDKITEMPFLFWKNIPEGIEKIEDLGKDSKRIVCVEAGSSQDAVLNEYPNVKLRYLDKILDAVMEIKYGKAFTTTIDHTLIPHLTSQYPELKVLRLPLPPGQQSFGCGVCINKAEEELSSQVRKVVEDLRAEGKIAELEKKWKLSL